MRTGERMRQMGEVGEVKWERLERVRLGDENRQENEI